MSPTSTLLVRTAREDDRQSLERLAALDSARPLDGDVLLAELDGRPVAALSLASGGVTADPFQPTADVVQALTDLARDASN